MAVNLTAKIIEMLKMAGIDYGKMAGKIDPNKVKQLVTKTQKTATKPKLIDALNKDKGTFGDALKIFEDEAQYLSQMNEMELANFANNLQDYFTVGGKKKNIPSNVVTTEGAPVVGKQFEKLAERKGAKGEPDTDSLRGSMEGLMTLVDEIKGISPRMRNQMDRNELAEFIQKMRGRKFTNEEIKMVREVFDEWGIGIAKDKATGMQFAKKLGAKDKDEFEFITEYVDNVNTYSPKDFKEMYGTVKNINMDISTIIDKKLEKHFKKKYKWDDTKTDGGLDDATFQKYEDELYESQKEFGDFHTVFDTNERNIWGFRKGRSWENHPNNYLDEASAKMEEITGQGLNVDFYKNYTNDVLNKYPEPEKFQYGGPVLKGPDLGSTAHGSSELASRQRVLQPGGQMTTSTGLNYLLGEDDNNRIPFRVGKSVKKNKKKKKERTLPSLFEMMGMMPPEMTFREPVNFPYKSLEDIPPNVLEMLRKDPNFDLETFLTKVAWSDPDKTRIQEKMRGEVSSGVRKGEKDEAWGLYSPMADMSFLNYQKFGKPEPIAGGLLSIKSPTDADKVQTILHEMRHQKMKEPWFWESSAVPKYVRETEDPHYSFQKYGDDDPNKFVGGEELYVRFMDQYFGDVAEKGSLAGSDYKPYFDKILKDHWTPYAKRYEEILKEEKRVKDRVKGGAYGLADGGRIPFQGGGSDASQDDFKTPSAYGMSPMEAQARGLGAQHHGSTTSWDQHAGNTGSDNNDNNNIITPPEPIKDPHDTVIDYIDKANQGWKAWNMINAGSMGGAAKAAFGFNPYAWAAAGLVGLDKRRKKKKLEEMSETFLPPETYADGGRIGFSKGKGVDIARRGFLKFLGGTVAGVAALKSGLVKLMGGKSAPEVKKVIDEVIVNNQSGAPSWFQPLVNKILREGEDAPGLAYGERQVTKTMDTPSGKVDVVYKLDSGEVELSFVGDNTALGEEVNLLYKPGRADEGTKGTPPDEFSASEAVPESHVSSHGEDVDWSIDLGTSEVGSVQDLASDLTELKTFATGEKATINEIVEGIKKKKERVLMDEEPSQWLVDKYGDYPYASGGLAGMLGE